MLMTGADIVVETLIEQGVKTVFGYPGGQVIDLYDALFKARHRLNHVLSSHEQHAAHAADGYARATGETGVVIATSGPGATNLVTGIATAYLDSVPMVAITGNVGRSLIGRDSFQECDITGITLPITKHNFMVQDVADLANTIREAFKIARSGRPGPVLVDIPKDIQAAIHEFEPFEQVTPEENDLAEDEEILSAVQMIEESKRPYIYMGGGALRANVENEIIELADCIDAPIGTTLMGISVVPCDHPRYLGMEGMHGHFASSRAQHDADLIICLGARFSDRATGNVAKYAPKAKIIHIDIDAAELNKNVNVELGIAGDMKDALRRIIDQLETVERPAWQKRIAEFKAMQQAQFERVENQKELTPFALINEISKYADPSTPIVTDVGQHQMWVAQYFPFKMPRTFITSGGLGTMGFGLGAAIGASLGTGKRTILFTGDGSFGMNLNDLATVFANQVPVVIVVLNNRVLGMVRQWQTLFYDAHYSHTNLDARQSDFVKIAEAFGIPAFRISSLEELPETAAKAMAKSGPVLIEAEIGRNEFVLPMLPPGGSMDQIITDIEEQEA
ncbi:biosynthetic-type acetolactate synthase large subunit [Ileibacterium valens]|uniref:Acetolactate synthase n=1 Tax=Ileibacterium valens TaxID=1862668 RepID=A0A1U7ND30_9FIRM|nr:biosynthetic-type acetolactate synthase large subunit [Ileibacterium valens]OLU36757.1 acetolactate synthase, large subunit, biosynthetic type [Ileibacterium valens]OLU38985.1 acetolactate synthase, large subunit, biosynthetic type [Erysipelotrichaceae bacterium NYU-BL-F16]OLU41250.1 acetolactate synthase, large subunit, biosynthetic type [Erysipelotrichaceae bacterium NYU-BL-E8]